MKVNEKLAKNHYRPESEPHIVPADHLDDSLIALLVNACPAGLYHLNNDGSLRVDVGGCLECATCRLLCNEQTLSLWRYPAPDYGIRLRFG